MKVLQINKFYHINGGVSRYFFSVSKLLREKGHGLAFLSMQHDKNVASSWSKYFVSRVSFPKLPRLFYSFEARNKISKLLAKFSPDIVHLHNIYHQISPSILPVFKKRNIPVIQTVGDYHLIAPNYNLFHNGQICEITSPNLFYKAVLHKCMKDSYFYSFVEVMEKYFQYFAGWERNFVDYFIAPSLFMQNKLIVYGIIENKIIHLPYFVDTEKYQPEYSDKGYILYFGRLSPEKGLSFLIDVMNKLPKIKLLVVGCGDEEHNLKIKVSKLKLSNIKFAGFKDGKELRNLIRNSRFTILPSLWYEVFGISLLEAFASGKPVITSDSGALPEINKNDYTGLLFESGNTEVCAEKINKLWNNPSLCSRLGRNARRYVEVNYGPQKHYERLMGIYKKAIALYN